ncbi:TonB family protein [Psychromonas sp. MME2]|uniref:energy transducer TonB n=1 Tax=unclassified Psychromonas TaxID=2614957 RepID=UPI00339C7831
MRYISNYLPFILITLFLYGLLFSKHKEATIIEKPLINSGQQAVQVDFMELPSTDHPIATENAIEPIKTAESDDAQSQEVIKETEITVTEELIKEDVAEKPAADQLASDAPASTPVQTEPTKTEQAAEISSAKIKITPKKPTSNDPLTTNESVNKVEVKTPPESSAATPVSQVVKNETEAQSASPEIASSEPAAAATTAQQETNKAAKEIQDANQKLQKSIQETPAINDATIKGALFDERVKLESTSAAESQKTQQKTNKNSSKSKLPETKKVNKPVFKKALNSATENGLPSSENPGALQEAIVVSGNKPIYPKQAILRNKEGRVVVTLTVTRKGKPKDAKITTSSGHDILDNAVLAFINNEQFMPALQGEEKITSEQIFSFRFQLK